LLALSFALVEIATLRPSVVACEFCRLTRSTTFHDPSLEPRQSGDGAATAPQPVPADGSPGQYVLSGLQWPQPGGKGTPITLTYSFQNMFDGGLKMPNGQPLPASLIRGSIEEALRLWSSVAPINFVEVPDDGRSYGSSTQFGQLRFRHTYINGPDEEFAAPKAKAQAYYPPNGEWAGDVDFDDTDRWQEVGTLRQPDILGAAIHEIGHSLGLAHSTGIRVGEYWNYQVWNGSQYVTFNEPKGNANMFWIFTRFSGLGTGQLFPDDIDGIRALYGAGVGSVTPIPEPAGLILLLLTASGWILRRRVR
jgi:hypothetical protein